MNKKKIVQIKSTATYIEHSLYAKQLNQWHWICNIEPIFIFCQKNSQNALTVHEMAEKKIEEAILKAN